MDAPLVLILVTDYSKHLCHGVVDTFNTAISASVVDADRESVYGKWFIHGSCELGAKWRSIIGQKGGQTSPERGVTVDRDLDSAFRGEFGCGYSEHVCLHGG